MGWEPGSLVGLKHVVGTRILSCKNDVGLQVIGRVMGRITDSIPELWLGRTSSALLGDATDCSGCVHPATPGCILVTLRVPGPMTVTQVVGVRQGDGHWFPNPGPRSLVKPVAGLNVVLLSGRSDAASGPGCAESLKQIVGGGVFLKDHHYILEIRVLRATKAAAWRNLHK